MPAFCHYTITDIRRDEILLMPRFEPLLSGYANARCNFITGAFRGLYSGLMPPLISFTQYYLISSLLSSLTSGTGRGHRYHYSYLIHATPRHLLINASPLMLIGAIGMTPLIS